MINWIVHFLINTVWFLSILCSAVGLYQLIISLFSVRRHHPVTLAIPSNRFIIVVAARNESLVIGNLIDSLMHQNYPRNLFDVVVVPNNCADDTAEVALRHGAKILPCTVPVKTKGQVLAFAFDHMPSDLSADAYCIFDADNIVHPDFLLQMNSALCSGALVAQGYRDSKNPHDTVISACMSLFYWMNNRFYNHPRSLLNMSAMVNGTGFIVADSLLKKMGGWRTVTMTEDIEFSVQCIMAGEKVAWVPEAITYDEQPMTFEQSWKQRKRWSIGVLQGLSSYFKPLVQLMNQKPKMIYADFAMYYLASVVQHLSVFLVFFGFVLRLAVLKYPLFPLTPLYDQFFQSLGIAVLIPFVMALQTAILEKKLHPGLLKGLFLFWFFLATWIPINFISLLTFKNNQNWDAIRHTRAIKFKDLPITAKK
jgi:cellulose synthase/poly-beta-1,6-N-acetylglucosamine synthase-like glycosyltransferase